MRRLNLIARVPLASSLLRFIRTESSFTKPPVHDASVADSLIYNVPTMSSQTVGRDAEVMSLWQNLLSGRRHQLLVGVDGIGKSTLAAAFCECARSASRFSCIQWFDGAQALDSKLEHFFNSMRGRKEKDVLLVVDDVSDPAEALERIPDHPKVFVLLTSGADAGAPRPASSPRLHVSPVPPLPPHALAPFMAAVDPGQRAAMAAVYAALGHVPLPMRLANGLVVAGGRESAGLASRLASEGGGPLSVARALDVLVPLAVGALRRRFPRAPRALAVLARLHANDLSAALLTAVLGEPAGDFGLAALQLGLFATRWERDAFALHPALARALRQGGEGNGKEDGKAESNGKGKSNGKGEEESDALAEAARCLQGLWPRRWRGLDGRLAYELVWHTVAAARHFAEAGRAPDAALARCMDRSATYLAHGAARDLPVAAELWRALLPPPAGKSGGPVTADTARIAMECGRLLHYLRRPDARAVLEAAGAYSIEVHGRRSAERALVMGCLAPYLDPTDASVEAIEECLAILEEKLSSIEVVLSREETKMLLETVFVLTMCKGQILKEMGREEPLEAIWNSLESIEARLKQLK